MVLDSEVGPASPCRPWLKWLLACFKSVHYVANWLCSWHVLHSVPPLAFVSQYCRIIFCNKALLPSILDWQRSTFFKVTRLTPVALKMPSQTWMTENLHRHWQHWICIGFAFNALSFVHLATALFQKRAFHAFTVVHMKMQKRPWGVKELKVAFPPPARKRSSQKMLLRLARQRSSGKCQGVLLSTARPEKKVKHPAIPVLAVGETSFLNTALKVWWYLSTRQSEPFSQGCDHHQNPQTSQNPPGVF